MAKATGHRRSGPRRWWRSREDRQAALLTIAGMAAFVGGVYVVVVLGGGLLIGRTESPSLGLSVLATAVVALAFEPVQVRLQRRARSVVRGGRPSPYDVLSRFSESVAGSYASEEIPARIAMALADGTGAQWAQVWLAVHRRLRLAATWPVDRHEDRTPPLPDPASGRPEDQVAAGLRSVPVRHGGELLGVLRLRERDGAPLTPVEERLVAGLAAQAGLVLRGAGLRAELAERAAQLSARAEELRRSRQRLVRAQDAERRRLERDIHDGAQQHLVALAVNLRLAHTLARRSPPRAVEVLRAQGDAARVTIDTLTSLSRGIYPRLLGEQGLPPALRSAARTSPLRVDVFTEGIVRYRPDVEAAVYFCCLEALQNAAKHSGGRYVAVDLRDEAGDLLLAVHDDGRGFDPDAAGDGAGLANMRDRIDSLGGTLSVRARPGGGVSVSGRIPAQRTGGHGRLD